MCYIIGGRGKKGGGFATVSSAYKVRLTKKIKITWTFYSLAQKLYTLGLINVVFFLIRFTSKPTDFSEGTYVF